MTLLAFLIGALVGHRLWRDTLQTISHLRIDPRRIERNLDAGDDRADEGTADEPEREQASAIGESQRIKTISAVN